MAADPASHIVAVGVRNPTGLALIDARTGAQVARVPLPGHLRHLQLAAPAGLVLVPDEDSGTLFTVGLPAGAVLSRVAVGLYPHDASATRDGTVAVADELGGALVLVRGEQVVHKFTDVTQPGGVTAVGDLVGVVDVRQHVLALYDAVRTTRLGQVPAGDGPTHVITDRRGRLVVVDTGGDQLLTFETTPRLARIRSTPLAGTPYGLAYDPTRDRLWVTLTSRNEVVGLDLTAGTPRVVARVPTVRQPNSVAVDPGTGRVFVAGRTAGTLQLIDPPG